MKFSRSMVCMIPHTIEGGIWEYLYLEDVLKAVGLQMVITYIKSRQNTVTYWVDMSKILYICFQMEEPEGGEQMCWR